MVLHSVQYRQLFSKMTIISFYGFYQGFLVVDFQLCFALNRNHHLLIYFAHVLSRNLVFCLGRRQRLYCSDKKGLYNFITGCLVFTINLNLLNVFMNLILWFIFIDSPTLKFFLLLGLMPLVFLDLTFSFLVYWLYRSILSLHLKEVNYFYLIIFTILLQVFHL